MSVRPVRRYEDQKRGLEEAPSAAGEGQINKETYKYSLCGFKRLSATSGRCPKVILLSVALSGEFLCIYVRHRI